METKLIQNEILTFLSFSLPNEDKIIYCSELEDYDGKDIIFIPSGKECIKCTIPFTYINKEETINVLITYVNNLFFLNPFLTYDSALNIIIALVKNTYGFKKVPIIDIKKIIDKVFSQHISGNLKPINPTIKYYWINPNCNNKHQIYLEYIKNNSIFALEDFFLNTLPTLNKKIRYKDIAIFLNLSEITIKRKISSQQKDLLKKHNNQWK